MLQITLKKLREEHNMSQSKLAKAIGVAQSTVGMWESGKNNPEYATLLKIADVFGVSIDYLTGNDNTATHVENNNTTKNKKDLTDKDNRDIAKDMERIREKLINKEDGPASFDGKNISEESAELLLTQIESMLRTIKVINKEKYNPYKNKEGNANGEN